MKRFIDLQFKVNPAGGIVGTADIGNGLEISAAMGPMTYGGDIGQWEVCVFEKGNWQSKKLNCLDGGDVQGWLSNEELEKKMVEIQNEINGA